MKRSITQQTRGWGRGRCIEIHQDNSPEQRDKKTTRTSSKKPDTAIATPTASRRRQSFQSRRKKKEMSYGAKRLEEGSPLGLGICTTGRSLNVTIVTNTRDELSVQTNRSGVVIRHGSKKPWAHTGPLMGMHTHTQLGDPRPCWVQAPVPLLKASRADWWPPGLAGV